METKYSKLGPNRAKEKKDWLIQQDEANIVLIQEHHLRGDEYYQTINLLRKRYNVFSQPALKHNVGTRGGVMILVDKQLTVQPWTLTQSTTKMWTAITVRMKGTDIIIATAYLPPDDNQTNLKTMQELAHMVGQAQCPYILGG